MSLCKPSRATEPYVAVAGRMLLELCVLHMHRRLMNSLTFGSLGISVGCIGQGGNGGLEVVFPEAGPLVYHHIQTLSARWKDVVLQWRWPEVCVHHVAWRSACTTQRRSLQAHSVLQAWGKQVRDRCKAAQS